MSLATMGAALLMSGDLPVDEPTDEVGLEVPEDQVLEDQVLDLPPIETPRPRKPCACRPKPPTAPTVSKVLNVVLLWGPTVLTVATVALWVGWLGLGYVRFRLFGWRGI